MKKLLYTTILSILSFVGQGFADSLTTGDPVLVIVSTGVIDTRRNWMDKINSNFSAISSTIDATRDSLATTSSTFDTRLDGFDLFVATADDIIDDLLLFNATAPGQINGLMQFNSTGPSQINGLMQFNSTATSLIRGWDLFESTGPNSIQGFILFAATFTGSDGGSSNPFSTGTLAYMSMSGIVGVASTTFEGMPGWHFSTEDSTFTITEIYASVANPSNVAATKFQLAWSTGGSFPTYSYVSPELSIPASTSGGVGISTTIVGVPNTLFSVHSTSVASTGTPASNASFKVKGWGNNRP